ncbi:MULTISPECIES: hypothetical protein [unclassified Serratia (in: enterobacteria)]|uniref:hypothetical protein n=1 Tax=unclassified Serratia (in: enterobacteria) TaxID=2647522 RepID=UPI00307606C8
MMAKGTNKYGLKRDPGEEIRRQIRQRCGFGCVICGLAFYDYEHFAPDFADAKEHNPKGMTLLCAQCNQKRARGRLSADTVARANASPKCLQQGFSQEMFDFGIEPITVKFAGSTFRNCQHLIAVNDLPLLSITPPKYEGQPVLVSGLFTNADGQITLSIKDNEFYIGPESWDVQCVGPLLTFRNGLGDISLIIRLHTPSGLSIERLVMKYQGIVLNGTENNLRYSLDNGIHWGEMKNSLFESCHAGIVLKNGPPSANDQVYDPRNLF